jgi:hypothetical protein
MSYETEREKEALVGDTISILQRHATGWGPRMDSILRNLLYTLLEAKDTSFLDIYHFLVKSPAVDQRFPNRREEILSRIKDPDLLRYWRNDAPKPDAMEPIISRMTTFVRSPSLNTFMGSPTAKLNLYEVMQNGKILIVNLIKSGRESGDVLGSLLVSKIQQAAMRRQDIPIHERRPFYLYTDEFERFQTNSFDIILSEAGKFKLGLVMANQYADQLDKQILSSIIGNVSTFILFRMDEKDARHFMSGIKKLDLWAISARNQFGKVPMHPSEIANLQPGQALYKQAHGEHSFITFRQSDITAPRPEYAKQIRDSTMAKYGVGHASYAEIGNKRAVDSPSCGVKENMGTLGNSIPSEDIEPQTSEIRHHIRLDSGCERCVGPWLFLYGSDISRKRSSHVYGRNHLINQYNGGERL